MKIVKYISTFIAAVFSVYLCVMAYFISSSDLASLVSFANEKSPYRNYGGPTLVTGWYLRYIEVAVWQNPELQDSYYLNLLALIVDDVDDDVHHSRVMNFMEYLIDHGTSTGYSEVSNDGMTVLHSQVIENNVDIVKFLLKKGAKPLLKVKNEGEFHNLSAFGIAELQQQKHGDFSEMLLVLDGYRSP